MTRNSSAELTARAREQFEALRKQKHRELGERVLDITGVRFFGPKESEKMYLTTHDIIVCEKDLEQLLGEVWAWYTSHERQRLYKNNAHIATSIAKLVLESAGHPLTLCIDESTSSSKYLLDGKLY
jgi:hypothetical protein